MAAESRTVLLAAPRSFCAGVVRAIEIVERTLAQRTGVRPQADRAQHEWPELVEGEHSVRERVRDMLDPSELGGPIRIVGSFQVFVRWM